MSAICIIVPLVVTAWPGFSTAILAATAAAGYSCLADNAGQKEKSERSKKIQLSLDNTEIVSERLSRDEKITVFKDGIYVTFSKDARNKTSICVSGEGYSEEQLRNAGEELSKRIVQEYVHQKIKGTLSQMQGIAVEESVDEDKSIRIKVRIWE